MSASFAEKWGLAPRQPPPPPINWWAVLAVVGSALAFFVWKGMP